MPNDAGRTSCAGPVPLARFFDPIRLQSDEWMDVLYFAIGPADAERIEKVIRWALLDAEENVEDHEEDEWTHEIQKPDVTVGSFLNDRYLAEGEGYAWCIGPVGHIDSEWTADEMNFLELCEIANKDADGCDYCGEVGPCQTTFPDGRCRDPEKLRSDWQELVNADPDHWPMAPLGPFEGVMVEVRLKTVRKVKADA